MMKRPALTTSLTLALLAAASPALAGPEGDKPAAPAAPAAAEPTASTIDPAAKALLEESAAAIKKLKSASFKVKRVTTGPMKIEVDGTVNWIRSTPALTYGFKGNMELPTEDTKAATMSVIDSKRVFWLDENKKALYDEPFTNQAQGYRWVSRLRDLALPEFLNEQEPLIRLLRARRISIDGTKDIHGEMCTVVKCVIEDGKSEAMVAISDVDKLPRMLMRNRIEKDFRIGPTWEIWDLKIDTVDPKVLELTAPEGWQTVKLDPPGQGQTPKPAAGTNSPTGGPQVGSAAPAFNGTLASGAKVSQDDFKGKVTVLGFWQPAVTSSVDLAKQLDEVAKSFKGQAVGVLGVACHDGSDSESVKAFLSKQGTDLNTIVTGDNVATAYNIRGFPSIVVIGPSGKVAAFYESLPSSAELTKGVTAAIAEVAAPTK